MDQGTLKL